MVNSLEEIVSVVEVKIAEAKAVDREHQRKIHRSTTTDPCGYETVTARETLTDHSQSDNVPTVVSCTHMLIASAPKTRTHSIDPWLNSAKYKSNYSPTLKGPYIPFKFRSTLKSATLN